MIHLKYKCKVNFVNLYIYIYIYIAHIMFVTERDWILTLYKDSRNKIDVWVQKIRLYFIFVCVCVCVCVCNV